jgi:flagellar motility protein MotE (MotC chaperone)
MNRILEIVAMAVGGLSLFLVCFVGFVSLSGRDVSQVAVIGKLFPAPAQPGEGGAHGEAGGDEHGAEGAQGHAESLSDAAVIEASLGVLSAWTLPSPYSSSELRALSEELKRKREELQQRELALGRRERGVVEQESEIEERLKSLEELRAHLEALQAELSERETELARSEDSARAGRDARWAQLAGVIGALEDPAAAAKRLQEYEPEEAAKVLLALDDDARAGEILNQVPGAEWKAYVDAYTAEKARASAKSGTRKK